MCAQAHRDNVDIDYVEQEEFTSTRILYIPIASTWVTHLVKHLNIEVSLWCVRFITTTARS